MYERMLDKQAKPTEDEFAAYCGACKELFEEVDAYLRNECKAERTLRLPYGNAYGWGMKYAVKKKHICDVFAEKDAFTVMMRMTDQQFQSVYNNLSNDAQKLIDGKYPCGEGGWIHYRGLNRRQADDVKLLLAQKLQK